MPASNPLLSKQEKWERVGIIPRVLLETFFLIKLFNQLKRKKGLPNRSRPFGEPVVDRAEMAGWSILTD